MIYILAQLLASYTLTLTGEVPVICEIRPQYELFCNAEYSLYIEGPDGRVEIERGGPDIKTLAPLPDGQHYVIVATALMP